MLLVTQPRLRVTGLAKRQEAPVWGQPEMVGIARVAEFYSEDGRERLLSSPAPARRLVLTKGVFHFYPSGTQKSDICLTTGRVRVAIDKAPGMDSGN